MKSPLRACQFSTPLSSQLPRISEKDSYRRSEQLFDLLTCEALYKGIPRLPMINVEAGKRRGMTSSPAGGLRTAANPAGKQGPRRAPEIRAGTSRILNVEAAQRQRDSWEKPMDS